VKLGGTLTPEMGVAIITNPTNGTCALDIETAAYCVPRYREQATFRSKQSARSKYCNEPPYMSYGVLARSARTAQLAMSQERSLVSSSRARRCCIKAEDVELGYLCTAYRSNRGSTALPGAKRSQNQLAQRTANAYVPPSQTLSSFSASTTDL